MSDVYFKSFVDLLLNLKESIQMFFFCSLIFDVYDDTICLSMQQRCVFAVCLYMLTASTSDWSQNLVGTFVSLFLRSRHYTFFFLYELDP